MSPQTPTELNEDSLIGKVQTMQQYPNHPGEDCLDGRVTMRADGLSVWLLAAGGLNMQSTNSML